MAADTGKFILIHIKKDKRKTRLSFLFLLSSNLFSG